MEKKRRFQEISLTCSEFPLESQEGDIVAPKKKTKHLFKDVFPYIFISFIQRRILSISRGRRRRDSRIMEGKILNPVRKIKKIIMVL